MASVFQRNGRWYASYKGVKGWTKKAAGRDKAAAVRIASALQNDAMLRREGLVDPKADAFAAAEKRTMAEHLEDFRKDILARRGNECYAAQTHQRAARLLAGVASVSAISPAAVNATVKGLREGGKLGKASIAHHLRAVKAFTRWLIRNGRTRDDALIAVRVPGTVAKSERVLVRRALSAAEFEQLVTHTAQAGALEGMVGADRAMLYRLAGATGFRQGELRSLTPESFDLSGDEPSITVRAAYSKRRKDDRQPVAAELAAVVVPWLDGKAKGRPVFNLPEAWKIADMIRTDAGAARAAWVGEVQGKAREDRAKTTFLADADASGGVLDFHALRVSYISWLVESGASVKTCQELARHSTPVLTIGCYARMSLHDQGKALAGLPVAGMTFRTDEPMALRQTGTDAVVSPETGSAWEKDGKRVGKTLANSSHLRMTREDNIATHGESTKGQELSGKPLDFPVILGQNARPRLGGGTADAEDLKSFGE